MTTAKTNALPDHLETSPQLAIQETTGPDIPKADLSEIANNTDQEVPLTTMEVNNPAENGGVTLNSSPLPDSASVTKTEGPKHLDINVPGEQMHSDLGVLNTKTDVTPLSSTPKFPRRASSLGLPKINTNLTPSRIPVKATLKTTSPTSQFSSPRDYIRSDLGTIKEEDEEAAKIKAVLTDWQVGSLFASEDGKSEFEGNFEDHFEGNFDANFEDNFENNFEDSPPPPEASSSNNIRSWLAKSFPHIMKPAEEQDKTNIGPATLKEDSEKQGTSKRRKSKLANKPSTSDGDSNDASSENSTIRPPSFIFPKGSDEPEETGPKIYWDGSMWPPENLHERAKLTEICKQVAEDNGYTEVVIMSSVITFVEKNVFHTIRRIYYDPHIKAVFSKPPPKDEFYPTKNVSKSSSGSFVRRYALRKPSTKASFDHQEVNQEMAIIHVGPNAEGVANWDPEEKEGWEKLGMWRKDGKEIIQWNRDYEY